VALATIARIERDGDSTVDGALIGSAVFGGLCVLTCRQGASSSGHHKQLVLGNAVMGGFFGWLSDGKREGTTVVYRRERRGNIAVTASPSTVALEVRLRLPSIDEEVRIAVRAIDSTTSRRRMPLDVSP
jgi:uncharacterized protein YcfJ